MFDFLASAFPPCTGLILLVTKNEESTFWLLKVLVEDIVPLYHTKKMDNLITDIDVLSELIRIRVPDVHKHISDLGKFPISFGQGGN